MKSNNYRIYICFLSLFLLTQCGIVTVVPPVTDPPKEETEVPPPPPPPTSVDNPLVTEIAGDPLKNGHPNIEPKPSVSTTSNFSGSRGADAFIGQIKIFGGNFAPRGWAFCNGQILSISSNQALFSLLGTTYGGDGRTTFALPDLRSRAPVHAGQTVSAIPANYTLGTRYGSAKANVFKEEYQKLAELRKMIEVSDGVTIPNRGIQSQATIGINYIIALDGTFPSRN